MKQRRWVLSLTVYTVSALWIVSLALIFYSYTKKVDPRDKKAQRTKDTVLIASWSSLVIMTITLILICKYTSAKCPEDFVNETWLQLF